MAPLDITFHIYDYVHQDECIIICIFNLRKYIYIYKQCKLKVYYIVFDFRLGCKNRKSEVKNTIFFVVIS